MRQGGCHERQGDPGRQEIGLHGCILSDFPDPLRSLCLAGSKLAANRIALRTGIIPNPPYTRLIVH